MKETKGMSSDNWFKVFMVFIGFLVTVGILIRGIFMLFAYLGFTLYGAIEYIDLLTIDIWFTATSIIFGTMAFVGSILTYLLKKLGVYLVIIGLFLDVVFQPEFNLFTSLTTVFTLFLFIGYGMVYIIPNWKRFT